MIWRFFLLATSLLASPVYAEEETAEDRFYAMLGDYQANRDQLAADGYACYARGMYQSTNVSKASDPKSTPMLFITAESLKKNCKLYFWSSKDIGNYFDGPSKPVSIPMIRWEVERVSRGVDIFTLPGKMESITKTRYYDRKDRFQSRVYKHDPFDDWLYPSCLLNQRHTNDMVGAYLNMTVVEAKEIGSGKTEITLHESYTTRVVEIKLITDDAYGGMPVELRSKIIRADWKGFDKIVEYGRYKWKKVGRKLLPHKIEVGSTMLLSGDAFLREVDLSVDWKVGSEVPEKCFDVSLKDPREPFAKLFGFELQKTTNFQVDNPSAKVWDIPEDQK